MNEKTAKRLLNRVASHLDVRRLPTAQELFDDPTISMKRMHPAPPFLEKQIWRRGSGKALPAIPRYRLRLHYDEVGEGGEYGASYAHRLCGLGASSLIGGSRAPPMTTGGGQGQGGNSNPGGESKKKDSSHQSHSSKHRINHEKSEEDTHDDQDDSSGSKDRPSHRSKTSSPHSRGYQQLPEAGKRTLHERQQQDSRNDRGGGEHVSVNQRQSHHSSSHRSHGGGGENSRSEASTKGRSQSGNSSSGTKASPSSSSPGQQKKSPQGTTTSSLQTTAIRIEVKNIRSEQESRSIEEGDERKGEDDVTSPL